MKRITLSLMAILTVSFLSLPAFAANQIENKSLSSNSSANIDIKLRQIVMDPTGFYPNYPTRNDSSDSSNIRRDVWQTPMLVDTTGFYPTKNDSSDEHYGIAPAWEGRGGDPKGMVKETYRAWNLPGIYDNTGGL
jgi:hypothetical protein